MEDFERVRHQYKPGDKVLCDKPNYLISKGIYTVAFESKNAECIYLFGPLRGVGFDKIRFEPVNEPLAPPRETATEIRIAMQEKQTKLQRLAELVAAFDQSCRDVVIMPGAIQRAMQGDPPKPEPKPDPFPGPPHEEPCEIRASRGPRRGKLHDGTALAAALERSAKRASAHPPLHIPESCKPNASP